MFGRSGGERQWGYSVEDMFVYVLQSEADGSQYVGIATDPEHRLQEHNAGRTQSTRSKRPWKRILLECFPNRLEARKREIYLKSAAGRRFRKTLVSEGVAK